MMIKNAILLIASLCVSLLILEGGLRLFTVFPIHTSLANRIYDEKLGYRMDPSANDVDNHGFRNKNVVNTVNIVTLGDSHTFGFNALLEDTWPQQLARMSNKTVYNFGVGGYGMLQYYCLMDDAIKLQPEDIIIGIFVANDLSDICKWINEMDFWQTWAHAQGYDISACVNAKSLHMVVQSSLSAKIKNALKATAIGSLTAYYSRRFSDQSQLAKHPDNSVIIDEKVNRTFITHAKIARRKRFTDLMQPDISFAFNITKDILQDMKQKADAKHIHLSVLFVPSKENVFFDYLIKQGRQLPKAYQELVYNERTLVEKLSAFFEEIEVKSVNARPYIVRELYRSGGVYPDSDDGHPSKIGYKAYAKALYDNIFAPIK